MRSKSAGIWILAAAIVVVGSVSWQAGANNAANNVPQPATIATVNLEKVINELDERASLEAELQEFLNKRQARIDQLSEQLRATAEEIQIMAPGEPQKEKIEEAALLRVTIEAEQNFAQQRIGVRQGEILMALFNKVQDAVDRIALSEGYDIIMSNDYGTKIQEGAQNGVLRQLAVRRMLYVSDTVDISDQVLQLMNNEWKSGAN